MAVKWADYLISAVRYNQEETHIVSVMSHVDNGDSVGTATVISRDSVISRLDAGDAYKTIMKDARNQWTQGALVITVTVEKVRYIKTVADGTKKDNLGSLPRF